MTQRNGGSCGIVSWCIEGRASMPLDVAVKVNRTETTFLK